MVLEYAENGNLRKYLENNFNLTWKVKLPFLRNIAYSLRTIHNKKYVHKDLHSGNILQFNYDAGYVNTKITDLGLAELMMYDSKSSNSSNNVCGVLPYIYST